MADTETAVVARHLLETASNELADYAAGFAILEGKGPITDAVLGGSGTLVTVGSRYAVLTADHVLENLPNSGEVGLILPTRFQAKLHKVVIDMALAHKIRIARGQVESEGPDLGALILPETVASTIKSTKSFYNLTRRQQASSGLPAIDLGVWLLCGMAHEWTSDSAPEHGYKKVKIFRGICGAGIVANERTSGQYDYIDFMTKYDEAYEGPQSFEGFSGGGLWQLVIAKESTGELVVREKVLSGVAFYQSALVEEHRSVVCHARQSIYGVAMGAIENAS